MSEAYVNYFRGRRVLVTGGLGFIGSNLCTRLLELESEITIIDRLIPHGSFDQGADSPPGMRVIVADIRDAEKIEKAVAGQEVIFNLAGISGASDSNQSPLKDLDINCRGNLILLEACRAVNPGVTIVFPSSRLVYGRPCHLPVSEEHPLAPESIYAVHKLTVENYLFMYARSFGMKATALRISNPYGPMQSAESQNYGIVNQFIQAAVNGTKIKIFGDGDQKRDYLYIEDLVNVLLRSAWSSNSRNKIYNIGSGEGRSLLEMAELAIAAAGSGEIERVPWPSEFQAVETGDYVSDVTRAWCELGWRPTIDISAGIHRTVASYRHISSRHVSNDPQEAKHDNDRTKFSRTTVGLFHSQR